MSAIALLFVAAVPLGPLACSAAERDGPAALEIVVDTSKSPEMAGWAARAKAVGEKNYRLICRQLASPGFSPPGRVRLIVEPRKGVAATSGTTIYCSAAFFQTHPDDLGAIVHELCHVVQAYGKNRVPGWVTEGIADYVRWFCYEPPQRRPRVDPRRAKYTDGYRNTAAFLDWINRTKDPSFVRRLNEAARANRYSDHLFEQYAGRPLDRLWSDFLRSAAAEAPPAKR
jgi:hypothetical protein